MLAQLPETDGLLVKLLLAPADADILLEVELDTLPLPVELLLGIELGVCSADGDGAALGVESCERVRETSGLAESDGLLVADTEFITERVGVARAVPDFEAETDFVPVGDIVPVFEGATLLEGEPVLDGDALRLSKDADADTEGDIVGSIVWLEEGAADALLLSEPCEECEFVCDANTVPVPDTLKLLEIVVVRVWVQVRKSVAVDVADGCIERVTEPPDVLLPTTLLLGDTEDVDVFDTELLPESVKLVSALRDTILEPDIETDVDGVFDLTADAENVGELVVVFERLGERVLVADRLEVLLCPGVLVPLTDTV